MNENDFDREFKIDQAIKLIMNEDKELLERLAFDVQ